MSDTHETPDAVVGKMDEPQVNEAEKCPRPRPRARARRGRRQPRLVAAGLNLKILAKNPAEANPLGEDFDYAAAFEASTCPR